MISSLLLCCCVRAGVRPSCAWCVCVCVCVCMCALVCACARTCEEFAVTSEVVVINRIETDEGDKHAVCGAHK